MKQLSTITKIALAAGLLMTGGAGTALAHVTSDARSDDLLTEREARFEARKFLRSQGVTRLRQSQLSGRIIGSELRDGTWVVDVAWGGPNATRNRGVVLIDARTGEIRQDLS